MTGVDPLAIDSRGWDPRRHDCMTWQYEPMLAFLTPKELAAATLTDVLMHARGFDMDGWIDDSDRSNIRFRHVHYRWVAPEVAEEVETENCRCQETVGDFGDCPVGAGMCGRGRVKHVSDFWGEDGENCPWLRCSQDHPMAVQWTVVWDCAGSDGPR